MSLDWVRLQTKFPSSPQILTLVNQRRWRAISAFAFGLAYAGGHDDASGFIHTAALGAIHATKREADQLVEVGLWEAMPDGYAIAKWDVYQQTNVTTADRTAKGKRAACQRWHKQPCERCGE